MVWRCRVGGVHHLNRPHHRRVLVWSMIPARARRGGGRTRWYHRLLWICGSAVHWAAASACCKDAVLTGASGPAFVKGGGHWEGHSAGKNQVVASFAGKSRCLTGRCAPQSGSEPAASLGWVNRDVRPLAAPLRPSPASQQRRRASMERSISAKRYDPLTLLNWYLVCCGMHYT